MLEKPDLEDEKIILSLQDEYGLTNIGLAFLPLGADMNTAVYRVESAGTVYFLKLRSGVFHQASVALPKFLSDGGIRQIIPSLNTKTGSLWANLDSFKMILYPFVEGLNGYEVKLSDRHWGELGTVLKGMHTANVPAALSLAIQRETYSPQWREMVKMFLKQIEMETFDDPIANRLALFLRTKRSEVLDLLMRAESLAQTLQSEPLEFTVCHSDIHAGNVLIGSDDRLYIVDWDTLTLAPKERDLMYIGAGLMGNWRSAAEEEALFYQSYGPTPIHSTALAYYRYERIIEDIAAYCQQLLLTDEGGEDREPSLRYLESNFLPDGTIAIAYQSDKTLWQ